MLLKCWNNSDEKIYDKKLAFPQQKEKFLAKEKKNFPIVPWNYFLDKITTVFCPYPYVLNNNVSQFNISHYLFKYVIDKYRYKK